jgi:hypothetical protein
VCRIYESGYYNARTERRTEILLVDAWKHVNTACVLKMYLSMLKLVVRMAPIFSKRLMQYCKSAQIKNGNTSFHGDIL